jgi:hypothetical protein
VPPLANDVARLIGALHAGPLHQPQAKPVRCIGRAGEAVKPPRAPTSHGDRQGDTGAPARPPTPQAARDRR